MDFDESIIKKILDSRPTWVINVQGRSYVPNSVDIIKSTIPVKKPSIRGGVYFSQTTAYKVKCLIDDLSIVSVLTSTMLGPNTDFTSIKITATAPNTKHVISANLTNYVQTRDCIELNLVVVDVASI